MKSIHCLKIEALAAVILFISPLAAFSEDLPTLMKRVQEYADQSDYTKAMNELNWVKKELEKMHFKKLEGFFPETVAGFKGSEFKPNSAMGFSSLERTYQADSSKIKLSLTGASSGNGLGGLAGIGKMAAMMGNQPGMDSFRIAGRTATLKDQSGRAELSVYLESGSVLSLKGSDGDQLKKMAEALKIEELDKYLRG